MPVPALSIPVKQSRWARVLKCLASLPSRSLGFSHARRPRHPRNALQHIHNATMPALGNRLAQELGLSAVAAAGTDAHLLLLSKFLRMFAYGSSTLVLAVYFAALGHSDQKIGLFMTLTLLGDVLISLLLTIVADALGRRRILLLSCVLMATSGIVFAITDNYYLLLVAAILGVISPSGNEIGPFRAVEESTLAHLSQPATRSDVFAWYVVLGSLGTAGGSLAAGWLVQALSGLEGWTTVEAYRMVFWVYAGLGVAKGSVVLLLSGRCEPAQSAVLRRTEREQEAEEDGDETRPLLSEGSAAARSTSASSAATPPLPERNSQRKSIFAQISRNSRAILLKLCALFSIDSLASGMIPFSLITYYLDLKFSLPKGHLGSIMATAMSIATVGNIAASSIAKRIGLVPTMVFTHLPSAIFLACLPLPPTLSITLVLLFARSCLASMDQAPRSAFLSMVVLPAERTAVMGIVNTLKTVSQSAGPVITGVLAANGKFWIAFVAAGMLKASYDLGLLAMFVGFKVRGDEPEGSDVVSDAPRAEPDGNEAVGITVDGSEERRSS